MPMSSRRHTEEITLTIRAFVMTIFHAVKVTLEGGLIEERINKNKNRNIFRRQ